MNVPTEDEAHAAIHAAFEEPECPTNPCTALIAARAVLGLLSQPSALYRAAGFTAALCKATAKGARCNKMEGHKDRHRYAATKESAARQRAIQRLEEEDAKPWERVDYVEIATGVKTVPRHRVIKGDRVRVEGTRGAWKVIGIKASKEDPTKATVDVQSTRTGHLRTFYAHRLTLDRQPTKRTTTTAGLSDQD